MENKLKTIRIAISSSGLDHVTRGAESWSKEAFTAMRERNLNVTLFKGSSSNREFQHPSRRAGLNLPYGGREMGSNGSEAVRVVRCAARGSKFSDQWNRLKLPGVWRLGLGSPTALEQTTFSAGLFWSLRGSFDILHTKDAHVALWMHNAYRAGLSRVKVILNHGTEEPPAFLSRLDYVQHMAPFHREEALAQGVTSRGQYVVPNFVDTRTFAPGRRPALRKALGIPPDAFVVLCVAALKKSHKRLDHLLREVSRVSQPKKEKIYVLLAGARTDETEEIVQLGRSLLGSRLVVVTDRPHPQMPEIYQTADLFALCSLKEMLGTAFLEAMASGIPAIGSRYPVTEWVIGPGGESIEMEREGRLAEAIAGYLGSDRRKEAGLLARQNVESRFSKAVVIDQQLKMYQEVLDDPPTS